MSLLRFVGVAALVASALAVVGCLLMPRVYGEGAIEPVLWASAVAFFGSVAGAFPLVSAAANPIAGASRFLAAMILRLGAVALGALAVGVLGGMPFEPFLLWLGASYLGLLVVDTAFALRQFRSL